MCETTHQLFYCMISQAFNMERKLLKRRFISAIFTFN